MKRAIIFGATGGIGQAVAEELATAGWSLYLHYNHKFDKAIEMSKNLSEKYPKQDFLPIQFDFNSSDDKIKEFVNSLIPVNAVVFGHGITKYSFLEKQKLADIDEIIKVNLTTPIKLTKLFEPMLEKQEFSRIVFLGSVYGAQGSALEATYSATKAAISRFSQAYAREVASLNLTVNVIAPGAVDTPMNSILSDETLKTVKEEIPAGRLACGKDISYWVKTLLDKRSAYLTGQTIYVSGGWLL